MSNNASPAGGENSLTAEYEPLSFSALPVDEELIKKAIGEDEKAFESIFMSTYRYVFLTVRRYLKNDQDAYDAIQETYTRVYRGLPRLESAASFYPWLHRIAENCAKDILRANGGNTVSIDDELIIAEEDKSPAADITADIADVLKQLPSEQSELLIRVYYDKMRVAEIARMQGLPATTVYNRLRAAKKNLKELLRIRGIEKPVYGGELISMVSAAIRNAIGTELLSMAVAEEILHSVTASKSKVGAFVISRFARTARSQAAIKIASLLLLSVVILTAAALVVAGLVTGFFDPSPAPGGENNSALISKPDDGTEQQSGSSLPFSPTVSDTVADPSLNSSFAPSSSDDDLLPPLSEGSGETSSEEKTNKFDFYFSSLEEEVELLGAFTNNEVFGTSVANEELDMAVSGDTLYALVGGDLVSVRSGGEPRLMIKNFRELYGEKGKCLNVFEGKIYWLGQNGNKFTLNRCNADGGGYYSVPFTDFNCTYMTNLTVAADGVYFIAGLHGDWTKSDCTLYRADFDFNIEKTVSRVCDYTLIRDKIYYLYGYGNQGIPYRADRDTFENAVSISVDYLNYQSICSVGDYIVLDGCSSYGHIEYGSTSDLKIMDTVSGQIVRAVFGEGGEFNDIKAVSEAGGGTVLFQYTNNAMTLNIKTGEYKLVPDSAGTLLKDRKYFTEADGLWVSDIDGSNKRKIY